MGNGNGAAMTRLGVMGGTFDPIHVGHLIAASEVCHILRLDRLMFVPTGQPWQKSRYSAAEDRYLMTMLGVSGDRRFDVSRIEIDRRGPTYTADTIEALHDFYGPGLQVSFIAGSDAVLKLGTWRKIDKLGELAEVIAVTRPGFSLGDLHPEPWWPRVTMIEFPGIDISATAIRERVATGRPIDYLVPAPVVDYIHERGLYVGSWGKVGA